ncbi:MAG: hypothetical protein ACRCXZ_01580 [Patescibacteria group bacterium]
MLVVNSIARDSAEQIAVEYSLSQLTFKHQLVGVEKESIIANHGKDLICCWMLPQYTSYLASSPEEYSAERIVDSDSEFVWYNVVKELVISESSLSQQLAGCQSGDFEDKFVQNIIAHLPNFEVEYDFSSLIRLLFVSQTTKSEKKLRIIKELKSYMLGETVQVNGHQQLQLSDFYLQILKGSGDLGKDFVVRADYLLILIMMRKFFGIDFKFEEIEHLMKLTNSSHDLHIELTSDYLQTRFSDILASPFFGMTSQDHLAINQYIITNKLGPKVVNFVYKLWDMSQENEPKSVLPQISTLFFGKVD